MTLASVAQRPGDDEDIDRSEAEVALQAFAATLPKPKPKRRSRKNPAAVVEGKLFADAIADAPVSDYERQVIDRLLPLYIDLLMSL